MSQHCFRATRRSVVLSALVFACPAALDAAPAARVDFSSGNATVQSPGMAPRPLAKGAEVGQGDMVNTGNGRVQLRFVDGAYVSLQPQSQFRIDDFRFNGKTDGTEKGFFSLLTGGLRTITGLVGRVNRSAYQVTTTVATIGIRGTEWTFGYNPDGSGQGSVGGGEINACNAGGCRAIANGESFIIVDQGTQPRMTDKKVDLPAPPPQAVPERFAQGENRDPSGDPRFGAIITGKQFLSSAIVVTGLSGVQLGQSFMEFDDQGLLRQVEVCPDGCEVLTWSGPVRDSGNDGIIAWGKWTGGVTGGDVQKVLTQGRALHYVAGLPTSAADLAQLRTASFVGRYELLGGTSPSSPDGRLQGSLQSASLVADFGVGQVAAAVTVALGDSLVRGVGSGSMGTSNGNYTGTFAGSGSNPNGINAIGAQTATAVSPLVANADFSFEGFFAGVNGRRAGIAYVLDAPQGAIHGTAGFTLTGPAGTSPISTLLNR